MPCAIDADHLATRYHPWVVCQARNITRGPTLISRTLRFPNQQREMLSSGLLCPPKKRFPICVQPHSASDRSLGDASTR